MTFSDLEFDEDGNCPLTVGDDLPVNVQNDAAGARFVVSAPVAGELPETTDYSLMQDLLAFALGPMLDGSPAVGRDPESGILVAYAILPAAQATDVVWEEFLERFVGFALAIRDRLEAVGQGTEGPAENPTDPRNLSAFRA